MYCPNCGAESTQALNYCKRCGGNLSEAAQSSTAPQTRNVLAALILAAATAGIVLGGFGILFTSTLGLIGPQPAGYSTPVRDASVVAGMMVFCGSATIALVTMMLIKLFSRMMGFSQGSEKAARGARTLLPEQRIQIPGMSASMHSVTEHTTRNFEPRMQRRDTSE